MEVKFRIGFVSNKERRMPFKLFLTKIKSFAPCKLVYIYYCINICIQSLKNAFCSYNQCEHLHKLRVKYSHTFIPPMTCLQLRTTLSARSSAGRHPPGPRREVQLIRPSNRGRPSAWGADAKPPFPPSGAAAELPPPRKEASLAPLVPHRVGSTRRPLALGFLGGKLLPACTSTLDLQTSDWPLHVAAFFVSHF